MFLQRLKLFVFLTAMIIQSYHCKIILQDPENNNLYSCVTKILEKYYKNINKLTFLDVNVDESGLIKAVNEMNILPIILRTLKHKLLIPNEGYLIHVRNLEDIIENFESYTREATWNPYARHVIIVKSLKEEDLPEIFNILMEYSIYKVIVMNGTNDADIYTYDPFENYGCGKSYDRIITYGKCTQVTTDLFLDKFHPSLRNCTLNVSAAHWPPYSFDLIKNHNKLGVEQYTFKEICDLEKLNINFINNYDGEEFSMVSSDMTADGPMNMLQSNQIDVILGGMILVESRASAFCYVYGHLTYVDQLNIMVKKASLAPTWKNFYLEFKLSVWTILLTTYVVYYMFLSILLQLKVKDGLALKMLGNLVLLGSKMNRQQTGIKRFFIIWIWFTYLINSFYQSSLVSLVTNPIKNYQIADEDTLNKFNLKPCLSSVLRKFIYSQTEKTFEMNEIKECQSLLGSVRIVSESEDAYTIVIYSRYVYEEHTFYDEWGSTLVYTFPKVYSKLIYGIFMNKGFLLCNKMNKRALQLRENGLVQKKLEDIYFMKKMRYYYHEKRFQTRFAVPWIIYVTGCLASTVTFVIEILSKQNQP